MNIYERFGWLFLGMTVGAAIILPQTAYTLVSCLLGVMLGFVCLELGLRLRHKGHSNMNKR